MDGKDSTGIYGCQESGNSTGGCDTDTADYQIDECVDRSQTDEVGGWIWVRVDLHNSDGADERDQLRVSKRADVCRVECRFDGYEARVNV